MPEMPQWARGGRIVWDDEHGFAFIRTAERRAGWGAYARTYEPSGYVFMGFSRPKLDQARERAGEMIGDSIGTHALALHPLMPYKHLADGAKHVCGVDYYAFQTTRDHLKVDCPMCLAVMAEDIRMKALQAGTAEAFEEKREHVRTVRAFNAFGRLVNDEDPEAPF